MSGRFARRARIAAAAAGGAVLLLGLGAWGLARSGTIDAWLTTTIAARLAPWVRFNEARAIWWPRLAVALHDVEAASARDDPPGAATAATVTCRVRLIPLLGGRVEIGKVQIDRLRLAVERDADGTLHAGGLEALAPPDGGDGGPSDLASLPPLSFRDAQVEYRRSGAPTDLARLSAVEADVTPREDGAHVELTGQVDGGGSLRLRGTVDALALAEARYRATIDADQIDAATLLAVLPAVDGFAAHGRLRVAATVSGRSSAAVESSTTIELADGSVAWTEWQAASPLRLAAQAAWDGTRLSLSQGRLEAARLSGRGLTAETIEATFGYGDGALRVETAQLRACGGTWRPAGRVTLGDPPQFDVTLQAAGVDPGELARTLGTLGVAGPLPQLAAPLQIGAQASGGPNGAWSGHASVATDGGLTWSDVHVAGPIQIAADAQVNGAAVALSNGRLQARRIVLGRVAIDSVDAAFSSDRAAVHVAPLRAGAFGGTWTYSGSLPAGAAAAWRGQLTGTRVSVAALRDGLAASGGAANADGAVDLQAQLSGTGTRAVAGTASVRLASAALTWDDLRVAPPAEVSATLRLQNDRLAVSNGRARAQEVLVRGVTARDVSTAFGYANAVLRVADLQGRAFSGRWQADGALTLGAAPTWNGTIDARQVDFGAVLDVLDPEAGGPSSADGQADLSLRITRGDDDDAAGTATLSLTAGTFLWDDLQVAAPAHASGAFSVHDGQFSLTQASAAATRAAYGPIAGSAAAATLRFAGERLTFDDLHFTSCGGTWTHSGWFTLDGGGPFAGQLSVQGAAPGEISRMLGRESDEITFGRVDLDSEFVGRAEADWLSHLRATGTVFLSDGTMHAATVLRPIWEALVGSGRVMDMLSRPTTHVQELSETFALRAGRVDTTDLTLISDDYSVTALGSIGLDGSVDLGARIQLTAQGVQKMLVLGSIPLPTSALPSLPPIPARVSGDLDKLVIRPNVSALPGSTAKWLGDALLQTPRSLGEAVLHNVGQLWGGAKRLIGADRSP
jgi:uncharacterized protein involved in outer membrane biogenesis